MRGKTVVIQELSQQMLPLHPTSKASVTNFYLPDNAYLRLSIIVVLPHPLAPCVCRGNPSLLVVRRTDLYVCCVLEGYQDNQQNDSFD